VAYYKATFPRVVGPGQELYQGNREEVARLFPNPIKYYNKNQAKKYLLKHVPYTHEG
jgi:hypothetical protein